VGREKRQPLTARVRSLFDVAAFRFPGSKVARVLAECARSDLAGRGRALGRLGVAGVQGGVAKAPCGCAARPAGAGALTRGRGMAGARRTDGSRLGVGCTAGAALLGGLFGSLAG
jgi:hypothetical protein